MTDPRVAVLVLNWNGWRDTVECLESLFRLRYPAFSVVLVDNASTDGSVERILDWAGGNAVASSGADRLRHLSEPPVPKPIAVTRYSRRQAESPGAPTSASPLVLIENETNAGFAGGTNVGLRYLYSQPQFDFVWVLNNDIVVASNSLSELVHAATRTGVGAAGPTLFEYQRPDVVQIAGGGSFKPWRGFPRPATATHPGNAKDQPEFLDYVGGGCMLARVADLSRVGTIDESYFMYGEDVDFSLRIRQIGLLIVHVPSAHAWHKGGAASGYFNPKHDYYVVRNNLYLMKKHFPRLMPLAFGFALYRFVLPKILRRQWKRLSAVRLAVRDYRRGIVGPLPVTSSINQS